MDATSKPRRLKIDFPLGNDPASIRRRVEVMEGLLERSLTVPGTRFPVGLDAAIGLMPVVGDFVAAALGAYIVWEGRNLGMTKWQLYRMGGNLAVDTVIGAIPLVGDAFDVAFRSNRKNLRIIRKHLDRHHPETRVVEG
ncbi:DUF4112 domain-containing protein [Porphyrobacter sp. GA68]|uniref:DUF4112 domain-containing protein n=1 Tax=Porphyrobacter sp. GA68 TaxID=2883480 RepID=UPI001D1828DD|nr:DUF4112 domain-containing protein [Porphyrobacter sp. GA68]